MLKIPRKPPSVDREKVMRTYLNLLLSGKKITRPSKYLHWDTLRHLTPPEGMTSEEWWFFIKEKRQIEKKELPFYDKRDRKFSYTISDEILKQLHRIDRGVGDVIGTSSPIVNPHTKNQYIIHSLTQEAITSSQLEGAVTTRDVAKEMIRSGRSPRDGSERMILNNYHTMERIHEWKQQSLSQDLIFEIHRTVTDQTLSKADGAGRFRRPDEDIKVEHVITGDVYHDPPSANELSGRMKLMCDFANEKEPSYFVHPVLRAIILHFWLAYDHPFIDGNGRTARALFYWSMLRQNYWLFEYVSISEILLRAPIQYARSFLYTETDDNDLTYFILHQIEAIEQAIRSLHDYIDRKSRETQAVESFLRASLELNHRQKALLGHALKNLKADYTVEGHRHDYDIAYDTARKDLQELHRLGYLEMKKVGKAWLFSPSKSFIKKVHTRV